MTTAGQNGSGARRGRRTRAIEVALVLLIAGAVFAITYYARVSYAGADARYSLLVTQSILERGTIRLDGYAAAAGLAADDSNLIAKNGHLYYYFPLGTSLFALPAVWLANAQGVDFADPASDFTWQNLLSAITCVLVYLGLYRLARLYLDFPWSVLVTGGVMFGSSFVSTLGTALWNLNLSTLFVVAALFHLLKLTDHGGNARRDAVLLGVYLFAAFICRPTTAVFVAAALVYLLSRNPRAFLRAAPIAAALLAVWLGFNLWEYGQLLAPYYAPSRLAAPESNLLVRLYGQWLSPSRGVLVYTPIFVPVLGAILLAFNRWRRTPLVTFCVAWLAGHTLIVSSGSTVPWWGGHSYGPRLMTDALPALFLLLLLVARDGRERPWRASTAIAWLSAFILLSGIGGAVHVVQGLYNGNTARWNGTLLPPDPGFENRYLFDWRYPQFAALKGNLCDRHRDFMRAQHANLAAPLAPVMPGDTVGYAATAETALFVGWSTPQAGWRWSECAALEIVFGPVVGGATAADLHLELSAHTAQSISVALNGAPLGAIEIVAPDGAWHTYRLAVPAALIETVDNNRLTFYVPAVDTLIGDPHVQGVRFATLALQP